MSVVKIDNTGFTIYYNNLSENNEINIFVSGDRNKNYDNVVKDSQCYIVVNNMSSNNVKDVVNKAFDTLNKNNYTQINKKITINAQNEAVYDALKELDGMTLNNGLVLTLFKEYSNLVEKTENENKNNVETEEKRKEIIDKFLKLNVVTKTDNGIMKKYVQRLESNANLSYMVELNDVDSLYKTFDELMLDDAFRKKISGLDEEKIAKEVIDRYVVKYNKKKYLLESSLKQDAKDNVGDVVEDIAEKSVNPSLVNKEVGVFVNHGDEITSVEKRDDDTVAVVENAASVTHGASNSLGSINSRASYVFDSSKNAPSQGLAQAKAKRLVRVRDFNSRGVISFVQIIFVLLFIAMVFFVYYIS